MVEEERFDAEGYELGRRIRSWEAAALLSDMLLLGTQRFCVRKGAAVPKFTSQFTTILSCPAVFPVWAPQSFKPRKGNSPSKCVFFGFFLWFMVGGGGCVWGVFLLWFVFLYNKTDISQRKAFCTGVLVLIIVLSLFCVLYNTHNFHRQDDNGRWTA